MEFAEYAGETVKLVAGWDSEPWLIEGDLGQASRLLSMCSEVPVTVAVNFK